MKYAYVRISNRKQNLNDQIAKLMATNYDKLIVEDFNRSDNKLPQFDNLIQKLQNGDVLMVTTLDRIAKNITEGSSIINALLKRGVAIHILNIGLIDDNPNGKNIANIFLALAEYEKEMIIERTQTGKEIARTKHGFREGRPPIDQNKKDFAVDLIINQKKSYNEVVKLTGLSKSTITRSVRIAKAQQILNSTQTINFIEVNL